MNRCHVASFSPSPFVQHFQMTYFHGRQWIGHQTSWTTISFIRNCAVQCICWWYWSNFRMKWEHRSASLHLSLSFPSLSSARIHFIHLMLPSLNLIPYNESACKLCIRGKRLKARKRKLWPNLCFNDSTVFALCIVHMAANNHLCILKATTTKKKIQIASHICFALLNRYRQK